MTCLQCRWIRNGWVITLTKQYKCHYLSRHISSYSVSKSDPNTRGKKLYIGHMASWIYASSVIDLYAYYIHICMQLETKTFAGTISISCDFTGFWRNQGITYADYVVADRGKLSADERQLCIMMTSWNGNFSALLALREGNPPVTKSSDGELWCFLWSAPEQTVEQTVGTLVIWYAIALIRTSLEWFLMGFLSVSYFKKPISCTVICWVVETKTKSSTWICFTQLNSCVLWEFIPNNLDVWYGGRH